MKVNKNLSQQNFNQSPSNIRTIENLVCLSNTEIWNRFKVAQHFLRHPSDLRFILCQQKILTGAEFQENRLPRKVQTFLSELFFSTHCSKLIFLFHKCCFIRKNLLDNYEQFLHNTWLSMSLYFDQSKVAIDMRWSECQTCSLQHPHFNTAVLCELFGAQSAF